MAVRLSVNINKIATLRNARGGNNPDVIQTAVDLQNWGAEGITVHPRPDGRHIRYEDVRSLRPVVHTEFNIEGYPDELFLQLVEEVKPDQVTLVPDAPDVLTSNNGWDCKTHLRFLSEVVQRIQTSGSRVSLFLNPDPSMPVYAAQTGTNRIELYTESYARRFATDPEQAIADYTRTAVAAFEFGLGINAGHDLDLQNLRFFARQIPGLLEVSIGHALICDALYFGLQNTVQMYKHQLKQSDIGIG